MEWTDENNTLELTGAVASEFVFSHEAFGKNFYTTLLAVSRLSSYTDLIPLMVPERLIGMGKGCECIHVTGQFRSYNRHEDGKSHLALFAFAREAEFLDGIGEDNKTNEIFLDGYVCRKPVYRRTPSGQRIAEILLAVNRSYGHSDYIPCICWGRNARFASGFGVGDHIQIHGRIQSREYAKRISGEEAERRIAYEVSASSVTLVGKSCRPVTPRALRGKEAWDGE